MPLNLKPTSSMRVPPRQIKVPSLLLRCWPRHDRSSITICSFAPNEWCTQTLNTNVWACAGTWKSSSEGRWDEGISEIYTNGACNGSNSAWLECCTLTDIKDSRLVVQKVRSLMETKASTQRNDCSDGRVTDPWHQWESWSDKGQR